MKDNEDKVLEWVAQSSDLNPIEHLWGTLKIRMVERYPTNAVTPKKVSIVESGKIDHNVTRTFVELMPSRIQAEIAAQSPTQNIEL